MRDDTAPIALSDHDIAARHCMTALTPPRRFIGLQITYEVRFRNAEMLLLPRLKPVSRAQSSGDECPPHVIQGCLGSSRELGIERLLDLLKVMAEHGQEFGRVVWLFGW